MSTGNPRLFQGKGEEIRAILADLMGNKLEPLGVQMDRAEMDEWLRVAVYGDGERAGLLEAVTEGSWDRERIKRWCRSRSSATCYRSSPARWPRTRCSAGIRAAMRSRVLGSASGVQRARPRVDLIHLRQNPRLRALREVLDYDHTKDTVPMSIKALSSGKLPGLIWHPQIFRDLLDDLVRWDAEAARKGGQGKTPPEAA